MANCIRGVMVNVFASSVVDLGVYKIVFIYSPTKVKHHLICFNNFFSNNELISNRFVFSLPVNTYLPVKQVIDRFLCMCI